MQERQGEKGGPATAGPPFSSLYVAQPSAYVT